MAMMHANPMSNVTMPSLPFVEIGTSILPEKRKALKCAIDVVQKMRNNKAKEVQPNSRTYNLGLEAFGDLLDKKSAE